MMVITMAKQCMAHAWCTQAAWAKMQVQKYLYGVLLHGRNSHFIATFVFLLCKKARGSEKKKKEKYGFKAIYPLEILTQC